MDIAISKMSSKGQIVIPARMRKNLKKGDVMIVIQADDKLILRKASEKNKQLAEDLEFARRTEEAYKRIEAGQGITMSDKEFKKWLKE